MARIPVESSWWDWVPLGLVPEIGAQQLRQQLGAEVRAPHLLDVRSQLEWEVQHITGATHCPLSALRKSLPELRLRWQTVDTIVVIGGLMPSAPAVRMIENYGFRHVYCLRGGMAAWRKTAQSLAQPVN